MVQLTPVQEVAVGNGVNTSAHASLDFDIQSSIPLHGPSWLKHHGYPPDAKVPKEVEAEGTTGGTLRDHFMLVNAGIMSTDPDKSNNSGFVNLADPVASAGKVIDAQFQKELQRHINDPKWHGPNAQEYIQQQSMYGNKVNNPYVPEVAKTGPLAAHHDFCDDVFLNTEHLTGDGHVMSVCENNPSVPGDTAGGCAACGVVNVLGAEVQVVPQAVCEAGCWVTNASHYIPVIAGSATALIMPAPSGAAWFFGVKLGAGIGVYVLTGGRFGAEFK
jgi:hypothetical protein